MPDFSYESDIAPMRGSYFSDANLNDRERKQLQSGYMQKVAPYQEIANKSLERMLDLQSQEISFQRANTTFEQEKLKLQQDRDAAEKYPDIAAQLGAAMEGKDPNDQRILVADIAMKNPSFFQSQNGSALLTAVNSRISAGATAAAQGQAKTNQVWNMAAQMGAPDIASGLTDGSLSSDTALAELTKRKEAKEILEYEKQGALEQSEQIREMQIDYIKDADKLYGNVKIVGSDGTIGNYDNSKANGGSGSIQALPKDTVFVETYRNQVINKLAALSGSTAEEVRERIRKEELSDADVHDLLGVRIEDNKTQLYRDVTRKRNRPIPRTTSIERAAPIEKGFAVE
jgi:hypothetical protein